MKRVNLTSSSHVLLLTIISKWLRIESMVDERLVSLTEDLYEVIEAMAADYEDRNFEIEQLLDQRLVFKGLDLDGETIEKLARYYIEKRA